jgi:hypothetical protein
MKYANTVRRLPGGTDRGVRRWFGRIGAAVFLAALLAISVDWLASAVGADMSTAVDSWWGARQGSPWDSGSAGNQPKPSSIDLLMKITGDQFTAQYTLKAPTKTSLAGEVLSAGKGDTGNYLVDNILGTVSIAEFRYGLTGSHYSPVQLTFHGPKMTVSQGMTTVVVSSDPVRLYLNRQLITIMPPAGMAAHVPEKIQVRAPAVQILAESGVRLDGVAKDEADLHRGATLTDITVSADRSSGLDWLTGLRGIGGIIIPVADGFIWRLGNLFYYAVLLWALVIIRFALPCSRLAEVSRNIVFTIVAAMATVALLALMVDVGTALFRAPILRGEAAAGPLALLVAGAALVWPVACFRTGRGRGRTPRRRPRTAPCLAWLTYPLVLGGYWLVLDRSMGINLLTNLAAMAETVLVAVLVWLLVRMLFGSVGVAPPLVSAGVLTVALGATIIWPVLYFTGWTPSWDNVAHVNVLGKWIFLVVAVLTLLGLGLLAFRAVQALPIARRWRVTLTLGIAIMVAAVVLPDAITNVQLADPHGNNLAPGSLIGLFDTLQELTDWLLLALAVTVAMSLPATSAARPLVRRIVIPIALFLLYWNDRWLYLPVTLIVGLIMLSRLVFPRYLAEAAPYNEASAEAISGSIAAWRQADFFTQQRQALTSDSSGALIDLIKEGNSDYVGRIESLTEVQDRLACERDRQQDSARRLEAVAFEQRGKIPDRRTAVFGAALGAILGIIPALITVLTTKPAVSTSGYPVLDFFGGTAWDLLQWIGLGWLVGYSLPLIRGKNGSEKALWLFLTGIGAILPMAIIWDDNNDWIHVLIFSLELLFFLMLAGICLCDLHTLRKADMRLADWFTVQHWHFVVTWSTALLAALGTAVVTFLSTAATNLSTQAINGFTGSGTSVVTQNSANQAPVSNSASKASGG